jgi:hypothetical protein
MTCGSWKHYLNAVELSIAWAYIGTNRWRGLPNNRLQGSIRIPDYHPQNHLKNYDMKTSNKEGQTWFYLQKIVVDNYALSILVIR